MASRNPWGDVERIDTDRMEYEKQERWQKVGHPNADSGPREENARKIREQFGNGQYGLGVKAFLANRQIALVPTRSAAKMLVSEALPPLPAVK